MLVTTVNYYSVMVRRVRFLLGFRVCPLLRKAGPCIPVFGYCETPVYIGIGPFKLVSPFNDEVLTVLWRGKQRPIHPSTSTPSTLELKRPQHTPLGETTYSQQSNGGGQSTHIG